MLINKKGDMTPFNMSQKPSGQYVFLLPIIWLGSFLMTRRFQIKITKNLEKELKPPYLVIATHQGLSDYYIAPLALFPHRAFYVSDMEGFAAFGKWLYRGLGCIGKRRFVSDLSVVDHIYHALHKQKKSVVIFPESRHSNVGTTSKLPDNLGKLVKIMDVPVVMLIAHGSYLANPFWDEEHTRKTRMEVNLQSFLNKEDVEKLTVSEIQKMIEEKMQYNEYEWQLNNRIRIADIKRAEGLHMPLYQCRCCGTPFHMQSKGNQLICNICHSQWEMDEWGQLIGEKDNISVPEWYEWEREETVEEIRNSKYHVQYTVRVEALPNAKGFVKLGRGLITQDASGITLFLNGSKMEFCKKGCLSVQTEYNYRKKGPCIVLSNKDCCYYVYSDEESFNPTKIQFVTEYFNGI